MAKNSRIKVVVATPCSETGAMKARTAASIAHMIIGSEGLIIDFLLRISCDIVSARTWCVQQALKHGATHLLFVDSDMAFEEDVLKRLLSHGKEIVGARYHKREFPLKWTHEPLDEESETELFRVKHLGTGMMLIDLRVIEKLEGPWFSFGRDSQGALVLGEDAWFCHTAQDAGFEVWCDPTIKVGHVGEYIY